MLDSRNLVNADSLTDELTSLIRLHRNLAAQYLADAAVVECSAYQKVFGDFAVNHQRSIELLEEVLQSLNAKMPANIEAAVSTPASSDAIVLRAIQDQENHLKREYVRNLGLLSGTAGLETTLKVSKGETTKRLGWLEGELNMLDHTRKQAPAG